MIFKDFGGGGKLDIKSYITSFFTLLTQKYLYFTKSHLFLQLSEGGGEAIIKNTHP